MLILAIDTSCDTLGISIVKDGWLLGEQLINDKKTHSVKLMPSIDYLLNALGLKIEEIDIFAIVNGPGSFTGLRIGVSSAKSFSYTLEKDLIGINTLDYLYRSSNLFDKLVCPIINARNRNVFYSIYKDGNRLVDYGADNLDDLADILKEYGEDVYFTGDGVYAYRDDLKGLFGPLYKEVDGPLLLGKPSFIGLMAEEAYKKGGDFKDLEVFYLRKSQAERMKEKNENITNGN